jgi:hypothetical protein
MIVQNEHYEATRGAAMAAFVNVMAVREPPAAS